MPKKVIAIK